MKTVSFFIVVLLLVSWQTIPAQSLTATITNQYAPTSGMLANPDLDNWWIGANVLLETAHLRISRYTTDTPTVLKLLFQNQTGAILHLTILNDAHEPVYEAYKSRQRTWGWWMFDLSALPAGEYTLRVKAAHEQTERTFTLGMPHPVVVGKEPEIMF
jgi:hypothetical protein